MYNFIHKILFCALHCYTVPRPGGPCEDGLPGRPHYLPPGGPCEDGLSGWYQQPGGPHDGLPGAQDDEIQTTNMDYSSLGNIQPDDQALNLDKENLPNDKPFDATSSLSSNMDYSDFLLLFMFLIALGRIFKRNTLLMFFWYISFVASIPIPDLSNDIPDSDSDLFFWISIGVVSVILASLVVAPVWKYFLKDPEKDIAVCQVCFIIDFLLSQPLSYSLNIL